MNLVFCLYVGNNDVNGKAVRLETGDARIWNSRPLLGSIILGIYSLAMSSKATSGVETRGSFTLGQCYTGQQRGQSYGQQN